MREGLLNPPREDQLARRLIQATRAKLDRLDNLLLHSALDRELYLQTIGARTQLADLLKEQERLYERETTK